MPAWSYSGYDSNYGSPAEDDVRLKMQQDRYAFASEIRDLDGPFSSVKLDAAYTEYQHKEIEDGETAPPSRTMATRLASRRGTSPSARWMAWSARRSPTAASPRWGKKPSCRTQRPTAPRCSSSRTGRPASAWR
nr:hypothetical protein [Pseudomonas denitrificans (nom. rej.)]